MDSCEVTFPGKGIAGAKALRQEHARQVVEQHERKGREKAREGEVTGTGRGRALKSTGKTLAPIARALGAIDRV